MAERLHIGRAPTVYGQNAVAETLCGRLQLRVVGHWLWGLVGRNRKDKCKACVRIYRRRRNGR